MRGGPLCLCREQHLHFCALKRPQPSPSLLFKQQFMLLLLLLALSAALESLHARAVKLTAEKGSADGHSGKSSRC